jgi:hypothetical protein
VPGPPAGKHPHPKPEKTKGAGHDEGALKRVPPGHAKHGG